MSARVVLLSFKDNKAAEEFCRNLATIQNDATYDPADPALTGNALGFILAAHCKLEAMVARPSVWCRCKGRKTGYTKSKRFGWLLHSCNKPAKTVVVYFIDHMLNGCR